MANSQTQLILTDYGKTLRAKNRRFVVEENGNELVNFPVRKVSEIQLYSGNKITTNALFLALQYEIPVYLMYRNGNVAGLLRSPAYGSIATIRVRQAFFCQSEQGRIWAKELIIEKITKQKILLQTYLKKIRKISLRNQLSLKIKFLDKIKNELQNEKNNERQYIMQKEAQASRLYFSALAILVPEEYVFTRRSYPNARDKFNAVLNYSYGILYKKIESALIRAGLDPYMGVLHINRYAKTVLAFDFMEKFRTWADEIVVELFREKAFTETMFEKQENNALWLNTEGKKLLLPALQEFLNEQNASQIILSEAQSFAKKLLNNEVQNLPCGV